MHHHPGNPQELTISIKGSCKNCVTDRLCNSFIKNSGADLFTPQADVFRYTREGFL
jgi:hypothetical protein